MFRQVIGTLFSLMEQNVERWKPIKGSQPVPTFGPETFPEPEPVKVNLGKLVDEFKLGYGHFGPLWKSLFSDECYRQIENWSRLKAEGFLMPLEFWVRILYELAAIFHRWKANREILISMMVPLYMARVASFVNQTREMDSKAAEALVEEQAA